jgi:phosphoglycolate phosphatase-like HAD superfamily hydrolase
MVRASEAVFGPSRGIDGIPMAGRTDPWIVQRMAASSGAACDESSLRRFHDIYLDHLKTEIHQPGPRKGLMPGVRELLDALAARDDVFLGLLTGNFAAGARVKLEYFDVWRYFRCGAFGEDAPDRNALFQTAIARVEVCGGPRFRASDAVVVGDTPLDVAVAVAGGARSVAVATGSYDVGTLAASGADAVLEDFSNLDAALAALGV